MTGEGMRCTRAMVRAVAGALLAVSLQAAGADPAKVLRVSLPRAETGFDPAQASEIYSGAVIAAIMEPLLTFDYLARPSKLAPLTAEALPEVADGGKRYTFRLKKGIHFAADPAFKGKPRELTAGGLHLRDQAARRSEEPLAERVLCRGQDRGPRRSRREGAQER